MEKMECTEKTDPLEPIGKSDLVPCEYEKGIGAKKEKKKKHKDKEKHKHKKENSLCSAASVIFIIISHFISLIFYLFLIKKYLRHEYENIFSRKESSFFYVTNQANYFFIKK
jgi:hypothetical protein